MQATGNRHIFGNRHWQRSCRGCVELILCIFVLTGLIETVVAQTYPGTSWQTKTPAEVGLDSSKLANLKNYLGSCGCVVRHGFMVYTWGSQSEREYVYSSEKPWYAHFLWKALEEGRIPSMDQKVKEWESGLNNINASLGYKDRNITWRHMANQTSCYGVTDNPGSAFNYNDYQMALFWDMLFLKVWNRTYSNADSLLHTELTDILQCQDNPTFMNSGHFAQGSLGVSARDFARFGLLYLHEGNWNGAQLISAAHARRAVTSPLPASLPTSEEDLAEMIPGQRTIGRSALVQKQGPHQGSYSWLWWMNGVDHNGNRHLPDAPGGTFGALGGKGNTMFVIPSEDIIVVWLNVGDKDRNYALKLLMQAINTDAPASIDSTAGGTVFAPGQTVTATDTDNKLSWAIDRQNDDADDIAAGPMLTKINNEFRLDGQPFDMWGIRVASASQTATLTDHLIAQLDDYKAHGCNTVAVFYMGSSVKNCDPFSSDGRNIDSGHHSRMVEIINACAARNMVVIVGIFYQHAPLYLNNAEAVRNAVRTVTTRLKPYNNIIINVANEQNSKGWADSGYIFDFSEPSRIIELCQIVHQTDNLRLVGGGGYDHTKNKAIGKSPDVDALLFDTVGDEDSGSLYDSFVSAGVTGKPIVNVEVFGADSQTDVKGVFSNAEKKEFTDEADHGLAQTGLSICFFPMSWVQMDPVRYDLGGQGTSSDPGMHWYFDYVKNKK